MTHVRLLKKLAVVAAAGLLALGFGAATASSASAAGASEKIYGITPSGEISSSPTSGALQQRFHGAAGPR